MTNYLNTHLDANSDEVVDVLDELPFWSAPFGLKLLEYVKIRKNMSALDIGFGAGFPLTEIAMRLGNSGKTYGIDYWDTAICRAEKKIKTYDIQNTRIIRGVAENIPLEKETIDLITSNNALNNVSDLEKSISECSRIIKKGGQFIQTMNTQDTMIEFYQIMENVLSTLHMQSSLVKMKEQIYKKRKPVEEYLQLLEKYDFTVNNLVSDRFEYKYADGSTLLNSHFIRLAFLDGWKEIVPADRLTEVFSAVETEMNRVADIKGCFILSVPFVLIDCIKR